ncbi:ATP-binding protein [Streptomyces hygroscopicus]|uniref:ATP-binding protein n=1 Tax=Streptomyces hygroscopicus TaxID=1912 RepID=UPI0036D2080D
MLFHAVTVDLTDHSLPISAARTHTRDTLAEHWYPDHALIDDAIAVASELTANAFKHALPPVFLSLNIFSESLVVALTDSLPRHPVYWDRHSDSESESGRGLLIVKKLSRTQGCEMRHKRKTVWAQLNTSGIASLKTGHYITDLRTART